MTRKMHEKLRKLEKAFNFNLEAPSLKMPGPLVTDQMFIVAVCEINGATMYVYIFSLFFHSLI